MAGILQKVKSDATHCLKKIADKTFDQETVKSLLMAVRENAPEKSLTREMANYVAHPNRQRGLLLNNASKLDVKMLAAQPGRVRFKVSTSIGTDADRLVKDLASVVSGLGLDDKPVHENIYDLILCYFGILHLAIASTDNIKFYVFKLSDKHCRSLDGNNRPLLSIISVDSSNMWMSMAFYSNVDAESALGDLQLHDLDFQTVFRAVRQNHALRLVAD
ncbi:MAG TPA: hypothetical protein VMR33_09500 [Candidatus Baltobacteraceae bacterium]|jgi:hypothetical protein|nr:hypothetical protein [Candidatus Baltobacteraceae bacterium]